MVSAGPLGRRRELWRATSLLIKNMSLPLREEFSAESSCACASRSVPSASRTIACMRAIAGSCSPRNA